MERPSGRMLRRRGMAVIGLACARACGSRGATQTGGGTGGMTGGTTGGTTDGSGGRGSSSSGGPGTTTTDATSGPGGGPGTSSSGSGGTPGSGGSGGAPAIDAGTADAVVMPPPPNGFVPTTECLDRPRTLLGQMTMDQKAAQLLLVGRQKATAAQVMQYGLGGVLTAADAHPNPNTPTGWADEVDSYHAAALASANKIPAFYAIDAVHGNAEVPG